MKNRITTMLLSFVLLLFQSCEPTNIEKTNNQPIFYESPGRTNEYDEPGPLSVKSSKAIYCAPQKKEIDAFYIKGESMYIFLRRSELLELDLESRNVKQIVTLTDYDEGATGFDVLEGKMYLIGWKGTTYVIDSDTGILKDEFNILSKGSIDYPPIIFNNSIIAIKKSGDIVCCDICIKKEKWSRNHESGYLSGKFAFGDEMMFVGIGDGMLCALDCNNGDSIWEVKPEIGKTNRSIMKKALGISSSPSEDTDLRKNVSCVMYSEGVVYALFEDTICSFDAISGDLKWKYFVGYGYISEMGYSDGLVLIAKSPWRYNSGVESSLITIDSSTGALRWEASMDYTMNPRIMISKEIVYLVLNNYKSITAFDLHSGKHLWNFSPREMHSSIIPYDMKLYYSGYDTIYELR